MKEKSVKEQLASGVFYTAIAKYSGILVMLLISAILARLISPSDFGVVAIATVLIAFFNIFSDFGIGSAIVQNKELTKVDLSNIFSFTVYLGLAIGLAFFLASWLIAWYYKKDILVNVCQLLSVNLFFASVNIVPNGLLLKAKRFKFIAYRTFCIQLLAGALSILAAFSGWGVYALLIAPILTSVALFIINFAQNPQRFSFKIRWASLKVIASYSVYQFLFNFINYFSRNLDKLVIGRYMGMSALGFYDKSYRLMILPLQNITHVVTPVMHPLFSDYQKDTAKLSFYYLKILRLLAFIGFPLSVLLFFASSELILIVFGNQWYDSIPIFRILSLSVGVQIILSTSGAIFQAANSTKNLFLTGVFSAIVNVVGLFIGLFVFGTLNAVAWAFVITFSINFFQCYWIMFRIVFKQSLFLFFKELISPLIVTIILVGTLYIVNALTLDIHMFLSLVIKILVGGGVTLLYIQFRKEYDVIGIVGHYWGRYIKKNEKE